MPAQVDIVLPCFNPQESWFNELEGFYNDASHIAQLNFIVVNDGSRDSKRINDQVIHLVKKGIPITLLSYANNQGKGYALRKGVAAAESEYVLYTDIDFPFVNESSIKVLTKLISNESDVVVGFRNQNYYDKSMTTFRKYLSKTFRGFIKNVLGMGVSDTQCGLKGFNRVGREEFLKTRINRYLFDFEFIYRVSHIKNIRLTTAEVQLKDNVQFSKMKFKIILQESFNLIYILLFRRA